MSQRDIVSLNKKVYLALIIGLILFVLGFIVILYLYLTPKQELANTETLNNISNISITPTQIMNPVGKTDNSVQKITSYYLKDKQNLNQKTYIDLDGGISFNLPSNLIAGSFEQDCSKSANSNCLVYEIKGGTSADSMPDMLINIEDRGYLGIYENTKTEDYAKTFNILGKQVKAKVIKQCAGQVGEPEDPCFNVAIELEFSTSDYPVYVEMMTSSTSKQDNFEKDISLMKPILESIKFNSIEVVSD